MIITVDGPTASGKGSLARALAAQFDSYYLDTGSLYRAVGYAVSQKYDRAAVKAGTFWTPKLVAQYAAQLTYAYRDGKPVVMLDGKNISPYLRTPNIDWFASHVSREPLVRAGLRQLQRDLGAKHDIVIDGRDCGTVIFPEADHKFFLTAALEVRVQRALGDAVRKAHDVSYDEMKSQIMGRDLRDLTRPISKLEPAVDAIIIDSTTLNSEQVFAVVKKMCF